MKASAALTMSHRLANVADKDFGQLGDLQRVLGLYGIDKDKWDLLRSVTTQEADGKKYMTPEAARSLSDDMIGAYLNKNGIKANAGAIENVRDDLETSLRMYFVDRTDIAVVTPDAKTHSIMLRGHQPGTVEGELLRFIAQFKSFPAAYLQKVAGREIYGYGSDTLAEALKDGRGTWLGIAQLMLWTTLFGYGSMVAKDAIRNKTPRDPQDPKTWMAAMAQGGGLGIYGDFLVGEVNRFGGGAIGTLAGPTLGTAGDVVNIWQQLKNGDPGGAGAASLKTIISNTPYMNLYYVKPTMDYLFLNQLNESLNPGYIRRQRQRMEKDYGQDFIIPPK